MNGLRLTVALSLSYLALLGMGCSSSGAKTSSTGTGGTSATQGSPASGASKTATTSATNGTGTANATGVSTGSGGVLADFTVGGSRPTTVFVPPGNDGTKSAPLLILLHGYTASGSIQEAYMNLKPVTAAHGMYYAHPDGTKDSSGNLFWNATDACCNFNQSTVDDSAYLIGLVNEIKSKVKIDPKQVYFMGHSNGGFMSYRMACDHAGDIAAIVSLAGATFADKSKCAPSAPVAVLEIHGDADMVINFNGGNIGGNAFPGAETTVQTWAGYDGCSTVADTTQPPRDIDSGIPGNESTVKVFGQGCAAGGHVELWHIAGGAHVPSLTPTFGEQAIQFLLAHPKP